MQHLLAHRHELEVLNPIVVLYPVVVVDRETVRNRSDEVVKHEPVHEPARPVLSHLDAQIPLAASIRSHEPRHSTPWPGHPPHLSAVTHFVLALESGDRLPHAAS